MGRLGRRGERAFREFQIEQAAVVGKELDSGLAKHGFEVGRREPELAGTRHTSVGRREAIKIGGGAGDRPPPSYVTTARRPTLRPGSASVT